MDEGPAKSECSGQFRCMESQMQQVNSKAVETSTPKMIKGGPTFLTQDFIPSIQVVS